MPDSHDRVISPYTAPLPADATDYPRGTFDKFPAFSVSPLEIHTGFESLGRLIANDGIHDLRVLAVDGYQGIDWDSWRQKLDTATQAANLTIKWYDMRNCFRPSADISRDIKDFLGDDDPIFGTHYPGTVERFFDMAKLAEYRITASRARAFPAGIVSIFFGIGAGLIELWDRLWYIDVPKDVIQERYRQGQASNIHFHDPVSFSMFYKRAYFVEWPALNRQKRQLLPQIDLFLDDTNPAAPAFMLGTDFRSVLEQLSQHPFRPRPWFYPGPWGGKYMQAHMGLDPEQPNFAWSFEMIVPENGITLQSDGTRLECSFDCLMFQESVRVLGKEAESQFKYEWPIRLDYLDTIDGGNLSTQCHPRPDFIRKHFGETYTQDETYYIANAKEGARVYLGLTEDCNKDEFRRALESSASTGTEIDIDRFVNSEPAEPHDLFIVPNGTVHCSGEGNLVLEISATPYIFTFKIYDYVRRDLEGNLRPLNIERAFENIYFDRRKHWVRQNLLPKPIVVREGSDWTEEVLFDAPFMFYEIRRANFATVYDLKTGDRGIAVNLVEGESVQIESTGGRKTALRYLESMLIPAGANSVRITNDGTQPCKLVIVYVKSGIGTTLPLNDPHG